MDQKVTKVLLARKVNLVDLICWRSSIELQQLLDPKENKETQELLGIQVSKDIQELKEKRALLEEMDWMA